MAENPSAMVAERRGKRLHHGQVGRRADPIPAMSDFGWKADGPLSANDLPLADLLRGPLSVATDQTEQLMSIGTDSGPT